MQIKCITLAWHANEKTSNLVNQGNMQIKNILFWGALMQKSKRNEIPLLYFWDISYCLCSLQ